MDLLLAGVGLVLLLVSGDLLVRGAVALSLKLGATPLVISLTVVAFGTSSPELLIAIEASLADAPGIVLGNVVGSNTANVLLVLGLPAIIAPLCCKDCDSVRTFMLMLAVSLLFIAMCLTGPLMWWHGALLLAMQGTVLFDALRGAARSRASRPPDGEPLEAEGLAPTSPNWKVAVFLITGLIGLPLGAHFLIEGARGVAVAMGISDAAIGLTLVAIGTSLPELATTVAAALRRQTDIAMGNVIGSNMFNILTIMGVASLFGPLEVAPEFLSVDLWVMLGASVALAPFVLWRWALGRIAGAVFLIAYVVYMFAVLTPNI